MKLAYIVVSLAVAASLATAQPTEKKYEPNQTQLLRLQVKQKDAVIAQIQAQQAQANLTQAFNNLNSEAQSVKKENNWPEDLTFSIETLKFSAPPKPDAEKKKPN